MRAFGNMPANCLHKNPAGTWSFVGAVDTRLSGINDDGTAPTAEQIYKAKQFGHRFGGFKVRTWATREAALETARELGLSVTEGAR
jgi:hypothetical protein